MGELINHVDLTKTLGLTECSDGFWLYDSTRKMNLSMRAKTPQDALIEALSYYQDAHEELLKKYTNLKKKVDDFVEQFAEKDD